MTKQQFEKYISKLVEGKVRELVPQILAEQYLKTLSLNENSNSNVVAKQSQPQRVEKSKGVHPSIQQLMQEAKEAGADFYGNVNEEKQHNPRENVKANSEAKNQLLSKDNPFSEIYASVKTEKEQNASQEVSLSHLEKTLGVDFEKMNKLINVASKQKTQAVNEDAQLKLIEKRLEERRRELEIPVPIYK
jgi:hypothetical protein